VRKALDAENVKQVVKARAKHLAQLATNLAKEKTELTDKRRINHGPHF